MQACSSCGVTGPSVAPAAKSSRSGPSPPEIRESGQRPPLARLLVGGDAALDRHLQPIGTGGPSTTRFDRDTDPVERLRGLGGRRLPDLAGEPIRPRSCRTVRRERPCHHRASAAGTPCGIRRSARTRSCAAARRGARRRCARSAPRRTPRARPSRPQPPCTRRTAPSTSSTLSSSSSGVRRMSTIASSAGVEIGASPSAPITPLRPLPVGHRRGGEVVPDVAVLDAGEQQHVGALARSTGTADLLVVGHRRGWGTEVQDEAQIGLVEPHAQRAGRDQRLDLVALEHPSDSARSSVSVCPVYARTSCP